MELLESINGARAVFQRQLTAQWQPIAAGASTLNVNTSCFQSRQNYTKTSKNLAEEIDWPMRWRYTHSEAARDGSGTVRGES